MTQSELEQLLAAAIEPIADVLADLDKRIDAMEPAVVEAARATVREVLAETLLDVQRSGIELRESACRSDRSADALRAQVAELILALERQQAMLRDGNDGVDGIGIRSLAQTEDLRSAEFEFTNDERHVITLPIGPRGEKGEPGIGVDAPAWAAGVYRSGTVVQHFEGRTYRAIADTSDQPGDSRDWQRLGLQGQRWCGPFEEGRRYEAGDLYVKGGTFQVLANGDQRCFAPKPLPPSEVRTICGKQIDEVQAPLRQAHVAIAKDVAQLNESVRSQAYDHRKSMEVIGALSDALSKSHQRMDQLTVEVQQQRVLIEDLQKRGGRAP